MIFQETDFIHNFDGISNSKDVTLNKQMLLSEIAYLIATRRSDFIDMVNLAGYKVKNDVSDIELADIIIENLGTNKKLATGVSYMIIERHEKKDNLDGDGACTGWDKLWGLHGCKEKKADAPKTDTITDGNTPNNSGDTSINASGILSSVTNLTSSIFGYVTEKEKSKSEKESDKMALMQSLVAMRAAESQPKSNTGLYVVLGVLAIGLIGLGIYLIKKKPAQVANK